MKSIASSAAQRKSHLSTFVLCAILLPLISGAAAAEPVGQPEQKARPTPRPKPHAHTVLPATAPAFASDPAPAGKRKMTLLIYMAGDNNLEPYIDYNRKQIERAGVPDDMNVLLYICSHRANEPKMATKAIIREHQTIILDKINDMDSGDKDTLIQACAWGASFESDYYGVILWDHGSGPLNKAIRRGICYDNTTGHFLSDTDLRDAFQYVCKEYLNNKKLSFIGFDACLMGALEIAYVIQPYARYMIASENSIPAIGWPYNFIIKSFGQGYKEPESFARAVIASYKKFYNPLEQDYTLSLIDLEKLTPVTENIASITTLLNELLAKQKNKTFTKTLRDVSTKTTRFGEPSYADLYDWYKHLLARAGNLTCTNPQDTARLTADLKRVVADGLGLLKQCVIASVQGTLFSRTGGLLIYLPEKYIDTAYADCLWAQKTPWTGFLNKYLHGGGREDDGLTGSAGPESTPETEGATPESGTDMPASDTVPVHEYNEL